MKDAYGISKYAIPTNLKIMLEVLNRISPNRIDIRVGINMLDHSKYA